MNNLKEQIDSLADYDRCAHVPPLFFSQILKGILSIAEPLPLEDYMSNGKALPKSVGPFTYQGYPCQMRCVEHKNRMYLIFCSYHNELSGPYGCSYIIFILNNGKYILDSTWSYDAAQPWMKQPFLLSEVTTDAPGIMSPDMLTKLNAIYDWCISKGMPPVE